MATPFPFPHGSGPTHRRRARMMRRTFNVVAISALVSAPAAAVALWLLLTDPVLAGEVTGQRSMFPVVRALVVAVGDALAALLAYL